MDVQILFLFGVFFSVIIICASKPCLIIPKNKNWILAGKNYEINENTRYFPVLLFISVLFVCFAGFQDIYAGIYDQGEYKKYFDDAINYSSLKTYLDAYDKEAFYMTLNWIIRHFTDSYNVVLILFFSLMNYSLIRFFYSAKKDPSLILFLSFFCLVFSFVVQSFCIMRTGISVSAGLLVFTELHHQARTKKEYIYKIIKIIFWTYVSVGIHTLGLFIIPVLVMYYIFQKTNIKTFMCWFIIFFIVGYITQFILTDLLSFYKRFLIYSGRDANPAYKTYFANLCLLFVIFYKRKSFFACKNNGIHFVIFMCSFYIYELELLMSSIMFRTIYFTRPSTAIIIAELWKIYSPKKNEIIIPLLVRLFLIIYIGFNFYGFITSMPRFGLNYYKFGGLY